MTDFRRPSGTTLTHASIKEYAQDIMYEFLTLIHKYRPKARMLAFKCHCGQYFEINQINFMNNVKQVKVCDGAVGPCPTCNPRVRSALRFDVNELGHRLEFPSRADKKPKKTTDSDNESEYSDEEESDEEESSEEESENESEDESDEDSIPSLEGDQEADSDDDCIVVDPKRSGQSSEWTGKIVCIIVKPDQSGQSSKRTHQNLSDDSDSEDPHPLLKRLRRMSDKK
jgi:hypothetical protein